MQFSSQRPNKEEFSERVAAWMLPILDHPNFVGRPLLSGIQATIFKNGEPLALTRGSWQIANGYLYLPEESSVPNLTNFDRLSALAAIAGSTGASEVSPVLVEKFTKRLVQAIEESTMNLYSSIISATHKPQRIAIDREGYRIAALINDQWLLSGGAPVEVGESWITLDF